MAAALALPATPAVAAQSTQQIQCDGSTLTIRTNDNHSSDMGGWSTAQVADGTGHLIPVSFTFSAYDVTTDAYLFPAQTQWKGNGNANHNQQTVTCAQTETGTLASFLGPGEQPPPGANLSDTVTVTFTVVAVPQP